MQVEQKLQIQVRTFEKNYQMRYQSSSLKVEVDHHQMIVRQIGLDYQMSQMETEMQHLVEVELHYPFSPWNFQICAPS